MAEITRKRSGELVRKAFSLLLDKPEGLHAKDAQQELEKAITLTDFEEQEYPNRPGVRRFEKIVRFSTIGPVKAGWLVKNKGKWILTDDGKAALKDFADQEEFMKRRKVLVLLSTAPDTKGYQLAIASVTAITEGQ